SVFGTRDRSFRYLPSAIEWGRPDPRREYPNCPQDSARSKSDTTRAERYKRTEFRYPDWESISGSIALQELNENDSLADFCLYLWGRYRTGKELRDTMLALAIFGQEGLEERQTIDVGEIGVFQSEPYFAMQLRAGEEFVKPGIRDLSRVTSYELPKLKVNVKKEEEEEKEKDGRDTTTLPGAPPT